MIHALDCYPFASMPKILERYQKCSTSGAVEAGPSLIDTQNSYQEYSKLKARVEVLQRTQRNLLGEDLGPLCLKELEQLENRLEMSLKQIWTTKTQFMLDQLSDLRQKEQVLLESNRALKRKIPSGLCRSSNSSQHRTKLQRFHSWMDVIIYAWGRIFLLSSLCNCYS